VTVPIVGSRLPIRWLGLGLVIVLSGCGRAPSKAEVPGTYLADYGFATDTLTLKGDGRFTETVRVRATGRVVAASGPWSFDPQDHRIGLDGMMIVADYAGRPVPGFDKTGQGITSMAVERWFGRLQLGGYPDVPYYKQAGEPPR